MTTIKIGTDICSIARVTRAWQRFGQRFLERTLTAHEIAYVLAHPAHTPSRLAARLAAKEAASKALGTGWRALSWKEIEVVHLPSGAPALALSGRAEKLARDKGLAHWEVSLSHEREFAIATVLAYSGDTGTNGVTL
jgi:holo-[acyl-carrier protein] synthase